MLEMLAAIPDATIVAPHAQRCILIHDNRKTLFRCQGLAFNRVEELLPADQFGRDEGRNGSSPRGTRIRDKLPDLSNALGFIGTDCLGLQL